MNYPATPPQDLIVACTEVLATWMRRAGGHPPLHGVMDASRELLTLPESTLVTIIALEGWPVKELAPEDGVRAIIALDLPEPDRIRLAEATACLSDGSPQAESFSRLLSGLLGVPHRQVTAPKALPLPEKTEGGGGILKSLAKAVGRKREEPLALLVRHYPRQVLSLLAEHAGGPLSPELRESLQTQREEIRDAAIAHYGRPDSLRELTAILRKLRRFTEELSQREAATDIAEGVRREQRLRETIERIEVQRARFTEDIEHAITAILHEVEAAIDQMPHRSPGGTEVPPPLKSKEWYDSTVWAEFQRSVVEPAAKQHFDDLRARYQKELTTLREDLTHFSLEQPERLNKWDTALNDFERQHRGEIRGVTDPALKSMRYELLGDLKDMVRSMGRESRHTGDLPPLPNLFPEVEAAALEHLVPVPGKGYWLRLNLFRACLVESVLFVAVAGGLAFAYRQELTPMLTGLLDSLIGAGGWMLPAGLAVAQLGSFAVVVLFRSTAEKRRLRHRLLRDLRYALRQRINLRTSRYGETLDEYRQHFLETHAAYFGPLLELVVFIEGCVARRTKGLESALEHVDEDFRGIV